MAEPRDPVPRLNTLGRLDYALARAVQNGWVENGEDVAKQARLSKKYWSATRSKLRANPTKRLDYDVCEQLGRVLRVRPYWLWKGVGRPELSPYDGLSVTQRNVMKKLAVEAVAAIPSDVRRKALDHVIAHFRFLNQSDGDAPHIFWETEATDILRQYATPQVVESLKLPG